MEFILENIYKKNNSDCDKTVDELKKLILGKYIDIFILTSRGYYINVNESDEVINPHKPWTYGSMISMSDDYFTHGGKWDRSKIVKDVGYKSAWLSNYFYFHLNDDNYELCLKDKIVVRELS